MYAYSQKKECLTKKNKIMGKINCFESMKAVFYRLKAFFSQEVYKLSACTCVVMLAHIILTPELEGKTRTGLAFSLAILGTVSGVLFVMGNYKKSKNIVRWACLPLLMAMILAIIGNLWLAVVLIIHIMAILVFINPAKLENEANNMA